MQKWKKCIAKCFVCLFTTALAFGVGAQAYPDKPIQIVVGYSPGGLTDGVARVIAPEMGEVLQQRVYINNRAGAGGTIAATAVAEASADGYTILLADHALMTYPSLYKLSFDTRKAFQPLSLVGEASMVIVVHPSVQANSLKELVSLGKTSRVLFASGGTGTVSHTAGALLEQVAAVHFVHVPYKGVSPAILDLLGGRVAVMFSSIGPVVPHITSGKLKPLAVTGPSRVAVLKDVPTMAEAGYPQATVVGYWGFLAPANIPATVREKVASAMAAAVQRPHIRQRLLEMGVDPIGSGPAEYEKVILRETEKWGKVVKQAGIKLE